MVVPRLTGVEQLHEANTPLNKSPRQQAAHSILSRLGIINPIELQRRLGLFGYVQCIGGGKLHFCCQFISGDASQKLRFVWVQVSMLSVKFLQKLQVLLLHLASQMRRWLQVEDSRLFGSKHCSLE